MFNQIKRNLLIYFRNPSSVFFSLLGALINFVIYIVFLKKSLSSSWEVLGDSGKEALDLWLIAGLLVITGITTSLSGVASLVRDRERDVHKDLLMSGLSRFKIYLSYIFSAVLIAFLMEIIVGIVMVAYFTVVDEISFPWETLPMVLLILLVSALLTTQINFVLVYWVQKSDALDKIGTIVGSLSAFLVGTYIPLGSLPQASQTVIKCFPPTYLASLMRKVLLDSQMSDMFRDNVQAQNQFAQTLGIDIVWKNALTTAQLWSIVGAVILLLFGVIYLQTSVLKGYNR